MGEFLEEDPLNPVSRGVLTDNGDGLWDALAGGPESRPEYSETLVFGLGLGVVQNELNADLGVLIARRPGFFCAGGGVSAWMITSMIACFRAAFPYSSSNPASAVPGSSVLP